MPNLPKIYTATADQNGIARLNIDDPGMYEVVSSKNSVFSDAQVVNVEENHETYMATNTFIRLYLIASEGSDVTITDGTTTITDTGTGSVVTYYLPNTGTWTLSAELDNEYEEYDLEVSTYGDYTTNLSFKRIYGVTWTGNSETTFTRTDDAAEFSNPNPYYSGNTSYGSPFDNIWPWSGMTVETIDGNSLVKIPKYWYKITRSGTAMIFQIANYAADGFSVSPAHQDRGDGVGERDVVYIGRYHCASDYKSKTGEMPITHINRPTARTSIQNLGAGYYLNDYALFWTIRMLYLVEFADWDSQKVIGYGQGNGSSASTMGYTDSMPYHTGTTASNRTTYGANTQYRYIEGLWDNVFDWCDGIRFSGSTVCIYTNPSTYSDSSGGTSVGTRATSSNEIKSFFTPSVSTLDWAMYPNATYSDNNVTTYVADRCSYYDSTGNVLYCGSYWGQGRHYGMFYLGGDQSDSIKLEWHSARLQYLPS